MVMFEICNHRKDYGRAIPISNEFTTSKNRNNLPKQTTIGQQLLVKWKDGSLDWTDLKDIKKSNPVEVAKYEVADIAWSWHTCRSIDWDLSGKALDTLENSANIFIFLRTIYPLLRTDASNQTSRQRQMFRLYPHHSRNRLANSQLPQMIPLAHRAHSKPGQYSCHPPHPARSGSHSPSRHSRCALKPTLLDGSQQSRIHLPSAPKHPKQNLMATSSQRLLQQTMDPDPGNAHSAWWLRYQPQIIVGRLMAQINPPSPLDLLMASLACLHLTICLAAIKSKKNANASKLYTHMSLHCSPNRICFSHATSQSLNSQSKDIGYSRAANY